MARREVKVPEQVGTVSFERAVQLAQDAHIRSASSRRKTNADFMKPMTPSATLAALVGSSPLPRTEVTSKLWGYIKKNNLQDKRDRRVIRADEKLRGVFGGKKQVSMFEMTRLVSKHLK